MLPSLMPDAGATDHDLILLIRADQKYLRDQFDRLSLQLASVAGRFEAIALYEQRTDLALATLRQDVSRAMLETAGAKNDAARAQNELNTWQTRLKTAVWIAGPVAVLIGGLAQEVIRKLVFP